MRIWRNQRTGTCMIKVLQCVLYFYSYVSYKVWLDANYWHYYKDISTHMSHARRDFPVAIHFSACENFYSHASCEAWRETVLHFQIARPFLLTRLMRGVTVTMVVKASSLEFLLTRLMRGVTFRTVARSMSWTISTHTPHARRDRKGENDKAASGHFYSHASCEAWPALEILMETEINFYSHASCEAWQQIRRNTICIVRFLLTRLMRGVTVYILKNWNK